ncbi:hypothetical protein [Spongiactinospora sp. TRM90649]|uniref:hypothetical protein n=1 Tax=Spongiactinospora sp. TRM90649 TaxID=3031114 RepID=UPI0023F6B4C1|nr:hypothetical protein [Spongiactinospora sp. TRM90649]MDF5751430.1 hypothetical protein [Spongiactinospora sp. TRM90649]
MATNVVSEAPPAHDPTGPVTADGAALVARGRYRAADKAFRRDLAALPEAARPDHCVAVAELWRAQEAGHRGLPYLAQALEIDPDHEGALRALVDCLSGPYRAGEAITAAREALARRPGDVGLMVRLSELLGADQRRGAAVQVAAEAFGLAPGDPAVRMRYGVALLDMHRHAEASAGRETSVRPSLWPTTSPTAIPTPWTNCSTWRPSTRRRAATATRRASCAPSRTARPGNARGRRAGRSP